MWSCPSPLKSLSGNFLVQELQKLGKECQTYRAPSTAVKPRDRQIAAGAERLQLPEGQKPGKGPAFLERGVAQS